MARNGQHDNHDCVLNQHLLHHVHSVPGQRSGREPQRLDFRCDSRELGVTPTAGAKNKGLAIRLGLCFWSMTERAPQFHPPLKHLQAAARR